MKADKTQFQVLSGGLYVEFSGFVFAEIRG